MSAEVIGPKLFERREDGRYVSAIGTLFPRRRILVSAPPMHALQRETFTEWLAAFTSAAGGPTLSERQLIWEAGESVDLILAPGDVVLIRPELERLDLALDADQLLQDEWQVPRHRVRFLSVRDPRVRQVLRERGEMWRMIAPPSTTQQMDEVIAHARLGLHQGAIYFYNFHTGTRYVTPAEFAGLAALDDTGLALQLDEIAEHSRRRNRHGQPEVAFFGVDPLKFGAPNFAGQKFVEMPAERLRKRHAGLAAMFLDALEVELQGLDEHTTMWRSRLFAAIGNDVREELSADVIPGVSAEFFPRIRWLPGGSFEDGEFIFSSVLSADGTVPADRELLPLWDPLARGFIANFIREYGNIEYLNLGRVEPSPFAPPRHEGRRGIYLAEIKVRGEVNPRMLQLRVLRWGIRERLEERDDWGGYKDLVQAVFDTEEYIDYTLDRRLGCLQFGMHLPVRVNMRRTSERYEGFRSEFRGRHFPVIYFERDYLNGIATNRVPARRMALSRYALAFARLLGRAAASNLVVGRTRNSTGPNIPGETLFDDGDEIIVENSSGLPGEVYLVDHGGAFADPETPRLEAFARAYARPVNVRLDLVSDPRVFAETYLLALTEELLRIQSDYRRRRRAFDGLFKHLPRQASGSFACRWERVLARLDACDPAAVVAEVRRHITIFG